MEMRTQKEIIEDLRNFAPTEHGDWTEFINLMYELWETEPPQQAYKTLFELLIRYENDYVECQWNIVHGMEHVGEYESDLVDSLMEKPVDLTLTMLSRIINVGEKQVAGKNIALVLEEILARTDINEDLRAFALDCKLRLQKEPQIN